LSLHVTAATAVARLCHRISVRFLTVCLKTAISGNFSS